MKAKQALSKFYSSYFGRLPNYVYRDTCCVHLKNGDSPMLTKEPWNMESASNFTQNARQKGGQNNVADSIWLIKDFLSSYVTTKNILIG